MKIVRVASLLAAAVGVAPPVVMLPGRPAAPPQGAVVSPMPGANIGKVEAAPNLASNAQLAPRLRGQPDIGSSQLSDVEGHLLESLESTSPTDGGIPTEQHHNQQDPQPSRAPTAFEWANSTMMLVLLLMAVALTGVRWFFWRLAQFSQPLGNKDPATEMAASTSSMLPPKFGAASLASEQTFTSVGGSDMSVDARIKHGRQALAEATMDGRRALFQVGAGLAAAAAPAPALANEFVTATFHVDLEGENNGAGQIKVRLRPEWAPRGVKRFQELSRIGDLQDTAVFHVDGHAAHFGLPAMPGSEPEKIRDDLVRNTNSRGTLTFRQFGPHSRVNEMFFNKQDNHFLDSQGYAPIGEVIEGMDIVDRLYSGYGVRPDKNGIKEAGNKYLDDEFPKLSKIKKVDLLSV